MNSIAFAINTELDVERKLFYLFEHEPFEFEDIPRINRGQLGTSDAEPAGSAVGLTGTATSRGQKSPAPLMRSSPAEAACKNVWGKKISRVAKQLSQDFCSSSYN